MAIFTKVFLVSGEFLDGGIYGIFHSQAQAEQFISDCQLAGEDTSDWQITEMKMGSNL